MSGYAEIFRSMRRLLLVLLCLPLVSLAASQAWAGMTPLDYWTWANPQINGNTIYGIANGNGRYVAVGDCGTILVSIDGTNWQNKSLPISIPIGGVAFGHGLFIAFALELDADPTAPSTSYILTSPDGENWSITDTQQNPSIYDRTSAIGEVAWGNGTFVAVGLHVEPPLPSSATAKVRLRQKSAALPSIPLHPQPL
jgi:hypothetical protein